MTAEYADRGRSIAWGRAWSEGRQPRRGADLVAWVVLPLSFLTARWPA